MISKKAPSSSSSSTLRTRDASTEEGGVIDRRNLKPELNGDPVVTSLEEETSAEAAAATTSAATTSAATTSATTTTDVVSDEVVNNSNDGNSQDKGNINLSTTITTTNNLRESHGNNTKKSSDDTDDESKEMFECNICFDQPTEPVLTVCGHLFCWACLHKWLDAQHTVTSQCPVCKAGVDREKIIPIYGRGKSSSKTSSSNIPNRPSGHRPPPVMNPNYNPHAHFQYNHPGLANIFGQFGHQRFTEGLSFFPFFGVGFGFQANFGTGQGGLRQREVTEQDLEPRSVMKRLLIAMGFLLLFVIIFLPPV